MSHPPFKDQAARAGEHLPIFIAAGRTQALVKPLLFSEIEEPEEREAPVLEDSKKINPEGSLLEAKEKPHQAIIAHIYIGLQRVQGTPCRDSVRFEVGEQRDGKYYAE